MSTHLRRFWRVLLALVILAAVGCTDIKPTTVAVTARETSRAPALQLQEARQEARDTSRAAVSLWGATVLWNATETWNAELGRQANLAAEVKRQTDLARSIAKPAPPKVHSPSSVDRQPQMTSVPAAIAAHFGTGALGQAATRVANCESTLNPKAVSAGGGNWGLFQINTVHAGSFAAVTGQPFYNAVLDAALNAQFARWLYDSSGGWGPWACRWAA